MGAFNPLCVQLPISVLFLMTNPLSITASLSSTSPQPPPLPPPRLIPNKSPLRPSVAVVVGVITTIFSITFLLLLYAKHCRRRVGNGYSSGANISRAVDERKNSGIDRTIIESLPVFRFGSLNGQKDGLECAVCLNQFDPIEVLRLLPKCKHAFHVECVDTWLDAHSTCPLCRNRVDPEDILLVEDNKIQHELNQRHEVQEEAEISVRRVSGRHSSAGERKSGFLQISIDPAGTTVAGGGSHRRSLDSSSNSGSKSKKKKKKNEETAPPVAMAGCVDRHRKDGLLLAEAAAAERRSLERRLEHRIIVSAAGGGGTYHRWSDVQTSDLLYLRTEMIISDSHRFSGVSGSRPSWATRQQYYYNNNDNKGNGDGGINEGNNGWWQWQRWRRRQRQSGRSVINTRSVSEITGLSRFRASNEEEEGGNVVSRWLAWRYLGAGPPPPPATSSEA